MKLVELTDNSATAAQVGDILPYNTRMVRAKMQYTCIIVEFFGLAKLFFLCKYLFNIAVLLNNSFLSVFRM